MDSLEKLVSTQIRNRSTNTNVTAVTLRIPDEELISLDEVASELNMTRQDVLAQFVSYGISKAQEMIAKHGNQEITPDNLPSNQTSYYLLNTNTQEGMRDQHNMLTQSCASAFFDPAKRNIDRLKEGDRVFLYQNRVGIIATGIASGTTIISDYIHETDGNVYPNETHCQKLDSFLKDFQITLKSCKEITKTNLPILRAMSRISEGQGKALLQEAERLKNQK